MNKPTAKFDLLKLADEMAANKKRRKSTHEEDKLQISCRYWFDIQYPKYRPLLHHSPNEGLLPNNVRDGAKRKAMGVRAGFPDFFLAIPNRFYPYLAVELKTKRGQQSVSQREWQKACESVGGKYVVVRTLDDFIDEINRYIKDI